MKYDASKTQPGTFRLYWNANKVYVYKSTVQFLISIISDFFCIFMLYSVGTLVYM